MKWSVSSRRQTQKALLFLAFLLIFNCSGAAVAGQGTGHQIYSPKHLSVPQIKAHLTQLGLGTASQLPGTNSLLITGSKAELIAAISCDTATGAKKIFQYVGQFLK